MYTNGHSSIILNSQTVGKNYPYTDEWINKIHHTATWMNLENIMLSERNQSKGPHMI